MISSVLALKRNPVSHCETGSRKRQPVVKFHQRQEFWANHLTVRLTMPTMFYSPALTSRAAIQPTMPKFVRFMSYGAAGFKLKIVTLKCRTFASDFFSVLKKGCEC